MDDVAAPDGDDAAVDEIHETAAESESGGPAPGSGAAGALRHGIGRIEDHHAQPQPIPQKWRRVRLDLTEIRFAVDDPSSIEAASAAFSANLLSSLDAVVAAWIASEEGQRDAYRPSERVLPSHFADQPSWQGYLAALRARRPAVLSDVRPNLTGVALVVDADVDFVDPSRLNVRIAIENGASRPAGADATAFEHGIFQVELTVAVPAAAHRSLRLDRIEPSYRFREWLEYPAMGLNCGVRQVDGAPDTVSLSTTWAPRYVQPRIDPRVIAGVPTRYAELADPGMDLDRLLALPDAYDDWIREQAERPVGIEEDQNSRQIDLEAYRRESGYIRAGIELLKESRQAARTLESQGDTASGASDLARRAAPWMAWLRTNETFAQYGGRRFTDWRLFQLAFILAHIPTLASRMPEFEHRFDAFRDELSASLLYFPTGGGKSEAFFGLLIFNLFLDRLRGKVRGVTALVRYPLRLLTLQQARRLMRVLVQAELVRLRHRIPGWPFELGFWVGSGNTPNRVAQGFGGVPPVTAAAHQTDATLLNPPAGASEAAAAARRRSTRYREALESFDKLRSCPCCGQATGMRKYAAQSGRIGIVCFNDACAWNRANPPAASRVPLPFLLTDDTIYQRAPSVVLGTVDKLALIGQHDRTINAIVGMFGCARRMDPESRHLFMPRGERALAAADNDGLTRVRPAYAGGVEVFHDPFPSLIIQDEGHLLDESLGTFSGLFETTLERIFCELGSGVLRDLVVTWRPDPGSQDRRPRLAKVIAATATISDPDRQLRVLYQRESLRFPCPGQDLYESFYAAPRRPRPASRLDYAATLPERLRPELSAPRMRVYASIMTNGRSHTMTTSAVVSAYHLAITRLWNLLVESGRPVDAVEMMISALPGDDPLTPLRAEALRALLPAAGATADVLATLVDLHRISLTYVTNKKGGDQIIETLQSQVERDHRADGIGDQPFETALISGGVTVAEIQDVMKKAEGTVPNGQSFPQLGSGLRNIVATSAISHGVDVDKFNAMFFAGLPTDVAEYIQASSRVGRTHVGFSLLVPTPHSRRDRYVVETHDQFHRFLERMIPPPAVQRWADRAIRRMIPSAIQAYLCAVVEQEDFARASDASKGTARHFTTAAAVKAWAERFSGGYPAAVRAVTAFTLDAIGLDGRGEGRIGAATHTEHYGRFVEDRVLDLLNVFTSRSDSSRLSNFWESVQTREIRKPMTSLRDVDAGGVIQGAWRDPYRGRNVNLETVRQVMRVIRGQRMAVRSEVDADPPMNDVED
ncbi:DEAD/DEAH box helicase [Mesorhizobium sp. ASY16-5R]|uniref:C-terminal helicase domain-containing protein n=1 Tax=Mesorhizobium sp. ASY16-5R TaxID=3445772 RepID=UPI003FA0327C